MSNRRRKARASSTESQETHRELPARWKWLPFAGDFLLAALLLVAPLVMGGREPLGKLVYLSFVTMFVACYLVEQIATRSCRPWSLSGAEWVLVSAVAILMLQLARLPREILARITPFQSSLLPSWSEPLAATIGHHEWQQISMTPHETFLGLGVLLAHAALFIVLVQRFQQIEKIETALNWIAIAVLWMATIGLVQYLTGTDKYVWLFEHESRPARVQVCGPFSNSNHFAHFLALGIGPLIWWLQRFNRVVIAGPTGNTFRGQQSSNHHYLLATLLATAVVAFAGLLAQSRGGMLVMGLAAMTAVGAYVRTGMLSRKATYGLVAVGILVVCSLGLHGYREVVAEVQTITAGSLDSIDQAGARRKIWQANLAAAQRFPMLGSGVGSHIEIYPRFFEHPTSIQYTHAESGYLQVLTETGVAGLGLLLCGWAYCGYWCWRALQTTNDRRKAYAIAIGVGLLVSATHSIFDFPWYLTSCASIAVVFAAAACCLAKLHTNSANAEAVSREVAFSPLLGAMGLAVLAGFVCVFVRPALADQHWTKYRKASLAAKSELRMWLNASSDEQETKLSSSLHQNCGRMAEHLKATLAQDPYHSRAHWRMAEIYLRLFEFSQQNSPNAMGLPQIRDAAIASNFESKQQLDEWLQRALGDARQLLDRAWYHVVAAMEICPLQGRVYLYAADLAFLRGVPAQGSRELISIAKSVRPYDAAVRFTIGREAALAGDMPAALNQWQKSFHYSREYRDAIINAIAGQLPAPLFVNQFEPDEEDLESLLRFYRNRQMLQHARIVGPLVVERLEAQAVGKSGVAAANYWHRCREIYRFLGDQDNSLRCAEQAVRAAPNWYNGRSALAEELMSRESHELALKELRWCLRRRPADDGLRNRIQSVERLLARDGSPLYTAQQSSANGDVPPASRPNSQ